jgi:hypothetical protein
MNSLSFTHVMVAFAVTYLLHSTVVFSVCWIVIRCLRVTSHHLLERVWKLAAVLGIVTAILQTGTGIAGLGTISAMVRFDPVATSSERALVGISETSPQEMHATITGSPSSVTGIEHFDQTQTEATTEAFVDTTERPVTNEPKHAVSSIDQAIELNSLADFAPVVRQSSRHWDVPYYIVHTVYAAVTISIVVGALLLALRTLTLRSTLAHADVLRDGPARQMLTGFLRSNQIRRRVRLLTSSRHAEPFACGLFGWTIVLPVGTDERLGPEELKALLAHEVAHLVRGDVCWLWFGQVLCACFAFQPLNFIARRRWQQAAECLCDDWAVRRGIRSLSLARCLTQIAEWRLGSQPFPIGLAAGGTRATLVQRVERLVEERQHTDGWASPLRHKLINIGTVLCIPFLVGLTPRIGLSLAAKCPDHLRGESHESAHIESAPDPLPTQAWEALQQELIQLESELNHANHLLNNLSSNPAIDELVDDIRQRTAQLRARREKISLSFGKGSE